MISIWRRRLQQLTSRMWVRATLFAIFGVLAALLAVKLDPFVPEDLPTKVGSSAVHQILNILASSMLAVTTFSLSVMVSAYGAATSNVTPRATRLLVQDSTAQNVLSVFLGTFLFSLVGIVALSTGYYSDRGRFVLFVISIGVIVLVVGTMLRWIDYLTGLGRVGETTSRVEEVSAEAIDVRLATPYLGGHPMTDTVRNALSRGTPIYPAGTGYVAYVDMQAVQEAAEELGVPVSLVALPGSFVSAKKPLAVVLQGHLPDDASEHATAVRKLHDAFEIEDQRSFTQDPRFGMCVLAEIASRALSPAVNDPGTAIDVIGRGVRLLIKWAAPADGVDGGEVVCSSVYVPAITHLEMLEDFFTPIARDGAGIVEVQIRLQKALLAIAQCADMSGKEAALKMSRESLQRAEQGLTLKADRVRVAEAAEAVRACVSGPASA